MPTKEQWAEIEATLSGPFGRVELKADGYNVTASVGGAGPLRQVIVIFVDGVSKGVWFKGDCPEAVKFCREQRSWVWPAKQRAHAAAMLKKKGTLHGLRDHYKAVAENRFSTWTPIWNSPARLVRHLRKACTDIEVVSIGYRG